MNYNSSSGLSQPFAMGIPMWNEVEFQYPSTAFFEMIEKYATELPLYDLKKAVKHFKKINEAAFQESLSELMVRLKREIAVDFENNEFEVSKVPYTFSYFVAYDGINVIDRLRILTALRSNSGKSGRIFYGATVFRVASNLYYSSDYGN